MECRVVCQQFKGGLLMCTTVQVQMGILPASRAEEAQIYEAEIRASSLAIPPCNSGRNLRAHADWDRGDIAR
jgi:hypothetical protein